MVTLGSNDNYKDRVARAFAAIPRYEFLPSNVRKYADGDYPLPIGNGATNSQPSTVRRMLELLEVPAGASVLDIGSGSGWTTALLGYLVGCAGTVQGIEIVPSLVEFGLKNLAKFEMFWVNISLAGDELGLKEYAPFDRILVSAMADTLPISLVNQLKANGIMVIPVKGQLWKIKITNENRKPVIKKIGSYCFVPLQETGIM